MRQLWPELLAYLAPRQLKWSCRLNVTFVYVEEAHAENEWPIGNQYRTDVDSPLWTPALNQSRTPKERLERAEKWIAERFVKTEPMKKWIRVAADSERLEFQKQFGAWPTGFYLLDSNRRVHFIVEPKHGIFDLTPLLSLLSSLLSSI